MSALEFHGFTVQRTDGKHVDLLDGNTPGNVHANLFIQREIAGTFVHWTSKEYLKKRVAGNKPPLTRRIYLNPRTQDAVRVFREVVDAASAANLSVKGKILDRSSEANVMKAYNDQDAANRDVRGDAIVLYAGEDEANELLAIAEQVLNQNPAAFKNRDVSSVPLKLAGGLAIGDEPGEKGASLTSHRAGVLEEVASEVRNNDPGTKEARVKVFKALWKTAASQKNINPDNMAFNARRK